MPQTTTLDREQAALARERFAPIVAASKDLGRIDTLHEVIELIGEAHRRGVLTFAGAVFLLDALELKMKALHVTRN